MLTSLLLRAVNIGAEWVLWVLLLLSFLSVGIIIERLLFFRWARVDAGALRDMLTQHLANGDVKGAWTAVSESDSIECTVLAAGLAAVGRGPEACSEAMLSARARERGRLDGGLTILATIGSNAPFIGLLGTVLGIVKAAQNLGAQSAETAANAAAQSAVMTSIFESLVATAAGLFVAIPAVVAFNIMQRKVRTKMAQVDSLAHFLLSAIRSQRRPAN